jgi:hypothetical protein
VLEFLLNPEKMRSVPAVKRPPGKAIFPDLGKAAGTQSFTEAKIIAAGDRGGGACPVGARHASPTGDTCVAPTVLKSDPVALPLAKGANPSPLSPRERDRVRAPRLHANSRGLQESSATAHGCAALAPSNKKVVVFDLETQKLADEVGGWKNISAMRLSVGVTYSEDDGFLTFTEENVSELIALLQAADLVVGFNQLRFDYEVLRAYSSENLRALPNLDICREVEAALGHRLSLDHLARFTLNCKKAGHGLDAVTWFREGKMDLLESYCREDVRITRDLYLFGLTKGFLLYQRKDRSKARIDVNW